MLDNHFKETGISDEKYEKCSELNGKITKAIFDKSQSIKIPPNIFDYFCRENILTWSLVKYNNLSKNSPSIQTFDEIS